MEGLHGSIPVMKWEAGDLTQAWKNFGTHVEFMFKGPLKEKDDEEKCAYLMIWVGERGREVYETWELTDEQKKDPTVLSGKFETYVKPKSNAVFNRYKFQCRVQQDSETCEQFVTDLKTLVKECGYENQADLMVRDRIVFGTKTAKKQLRTMNEGEDPNVNAVGRTKPFKQHNRRPEQKQERKHVQQFRQQAPTQSRKLFTNQGARPKEFGQYQQKSACNRCGYDHIKHKCPAMGKTCKACGFRDHFAKMCKSRKNDRPIYELEEDDYDYDALFVGSIHSNRKHKTRKTDTFSETLTVHNKEINFQLDTGAKCNVLSRADFKMLNIKGPLRKADVGLRSFSGHRMLPDGMITLQLNCKKMMHNVEFYIVETNSQSVLSGETSEEIGLIKRMHGIETSYNNLFEGIGCLPGLHHINIDKTVTPVIHAPRKIPLAIKEKVKNELNKMEKLGVVVKQKQPTEWVNSMVTVVKGNGDVRICIDPKDLNNAIKREHFPMKTVEEVVAEMPNAKVFSKLDATSGFWQLQLDEESSLLTTFNTPFGRYRFMRARFGIKSIPEIVQRTMTEMIEGLKGTQVIVDDILIWGSDIKEHDQRLKQLLERAKQWNLKLSPTKCQFRKEEVDYVGHKLTKDGVKSDPEKVRAVKHMKKPKDKKELQTFLGFITYLAKFLPNMSEVSAPLRILLNKDTEWHWEKQQDDSFEKLKEMSSKAPVLTFYDKNEELVLNVDASSRGLGGVLLQKGKPIAYASKALNTTQQKYSQIEKETLAIVFGCEKFHHYVYGRHIQVESDHKPLEYIFKKPITEAPPRVQRFALTLQKYDFSVTYKPGKTMYLSDTLSRLYLEETGETIPDIDINQIQFNAHMPMTPKKYEELKNDTKSDDNLQLLKRTIEQGWPEKRTEVPESIRQYWQIRHEITVIDDILFKGQKVIIPANQRNEMLKLVHETHSGIVKSKTRAREFMYCPGMMAQIQELVERCNVCATNNKKANHKEPMISSEIPDRPSSKVGADLFEYQREHYLLTVDYYSKWPEVEKLDNLTSGNVISYLKKQFARYGYIDELISDNGPQFSSAEFKTFAEEYNFVHTTVSPHYQQANGQTERYVQTVKNMIKKGKNPSKALLDYRNTPLEGINLSPAQLHIGRRLKSSLPTTAALLKPQTHDRNHIKVGHDKRQKTQRTDFDKRSGKPLTSLNQGESIMIKHNNQMVPGTVVKKHQTPRSYIVETMQGRKLRRNRQHLKPTKAQFQPEIQFQPERVEISENPNLNEKSSVNSEDQSVVLEKKSVRSQN